MARLGTVAIVGVGLIGGSIGMALRARKLAGRVVGVGRTEDRLRIAARLGAIDAGETELRRALAEAEVVIVCTPVDRIGHDVIEAARLAPAGVLITDAGSTKGRIVAEVESDPTAASRFVGAHPIAGSERSGVEAATPELFEGRPCLCVRTAKTPADRCDRTEAFWTGIGCRVSWMTPDEHDAALALTSHLPHAVASALAGTARLGPAFRGGAFRDGTRVAHADAALWTAIFLENREHVLAALDAYSLRLDEFRRALAQGDSTAVHRWWAENQSATTETTRPEGSR